MISSKCCMLAASLHFAVAMPARLGDASAVFALLERKLPGRETWFRKGNATAQDARPDGLGASEKPLLTPGTRAWYDEWRAVRARQRKSRAAREWAKTGRPPVEDYAKPGQAVGKPLSIEELKFTPLGRAKLQLDRQHIPYNRFVVDIMKEEIKEPEYLLCCACGEITVGNICC